MAFSLCRVDSSWKPDSLEVLFRNLTWASGIQTEPQKGSENYHHHVVLWQVHRVFQKFSTECDLVLPLSVASTFSFLGHPVAAYVFFIVFPSLLRTWSKLHTWIWGLRWSQQWCWTCKFSWNVLSQKFYCNQKVCYHKKSYYVTVSFLRQLKLVPVITFFSVRYVFNIILARPNLTIVRVTWIWEFCVCEWRQFIWIIIRRIYVQSWCGRGECPFSSVTLGGICISHKASIVDEFKP
jgi:hypothetical protein